MIDQWRITKTRKLIWNKEANNFLPNTLVSVQLDSRQFEEITKWLEKQVGSQGQEQLGKKWYVVSVNIHHPSKLVMDEKLYTMFSLKWV